MSYCSNCGSEVNDNQEACLNCGFILKNKNEVINSKINPTSYFVIGLLVPMGGLILGLILMDIVIR